MSSLKGKHILLGITGSVAAYKAAHLIRLLTDAGASVQATLTPAAQHFIGIATIQALTGRPVLTDMFAGTGSPDGMDHIAAVRKADIMVIAPATASTLARIASGTADDPVAALACAATCPILLAPAMNHEMWANPAVTRNIALLRADGRQLVEPASGELACGEHGPGRLAEPTTIVAAITACLTSSIRTDSLTGRTVVVSAGATAENIDDMRILTNRSSGRMGFAIAAAARDAGAQVRLIAATTAVAPPAGMARTVIVTNVDQMHKEALRQARGADAFFAVAAVSDFRPRQRQPGKIPRQAGPLTLELEACPDVIAAVATQRNAPFCIAFAAAAGSMPTAIKAARAKMKTKGVTAIVASPIAANLGGTNCDLVFLAARTRVALGPQTKAAAAAQLITLVAARLPSRTK